MCCLLHTATVLMSGPQCEIGFTDCFEISSHQRTLCLNCEICDKMKTLLPAELCCVCRLLFVYRPHPITSNNVPSFYLSFLSSFTFSSSLLFLSLTFFQFPTFPFPAPIFCIFFFLLSRLLSMPPSGHRLPRSRGLAAAASGWCVSAVRHAGSRGPRH